jgi:hypothetical protein
MFISQNYIVYGFLIVNIMTSEIEDIIILTTFFESSRVPCLDIFMSAIYLCFFSCTSVTNIY